MPRPPLPGAGGPGVGAAAGAGIVLLHPPLPAPPSAASAGAPKHSKCVQIPNSRVGTVIGVKGATVAQIEHMTAVSITIEKTPVASNGTTVPIAELARNLHVESSNPAAIAQAEKLILDLLADKIDGRLLAKGIIQPVSKPPRHAG